MTDRELLELAAKAIGLEAAWVEYQDQAPETEAPEGFFVLKGAAPHNRRMGDGICWNPLTDDGDALRLAVKLGIKIELHPEWVYARAIVRRLEYLNIMEGWAHGGDAYAATRRAIVRAAAAMAKQEPDHG